MAFGGKLSAEPSGIESEFSATVRKREKSGFILA
jgi:hypothetical protein